MQSSSNSSRATQPSNMLGRMYPPPSASYPSSLPGRDGIASSASRGVYEAARNESLQALHPISENLTSQDDCECDCHHSSQLGTALNGMASLCTLGA